MSHKAPPLLRLVNITKRFGDVIVIPGLDLDIHEGEFFTIVGPSGSGKSTLVRLLVGMEEVSQGSIWLRDLRIDSIPANRRPTCMVFQSLALFPHMSVGHNIEFPLKLRKTAPEQRKARALELMELLRLPASYYDKKIAQCSGGEQQRVALARALAFDPEILFFDEPLSSLDYRLRKTLEKELKELHLRTGKTFVYITHSLEEAMVMSDRIAILNHGQFEQIATADEIYNRPISRFVAEFMGEVNLFDIDGMASLEQHGIAVSGQKGQDWLAQAAEAKSILMIRPEHVRFLNSDSSADFIIRGALKGEYALGSRRQYEVESANGATIIVEKLRKESYYSEFGNMVTLGFDGDDAHLIRSR